MLKLYCIYALYIFDFLGFWNRFSGNGEGCGFGGVRGAVAGEGGAEAGVRLRAQGPERDLRLARSDSVVEEARSRRAF